MQMQLGISALLFAYAFGSNVAIAVIPHEPVVAWAGSRIGILPTALISTAATVCAAWVDHRLFVPLLAARSNEAGIAVSLRRAFARAPLAILALSGLTPLPFWPFKALAFSSGYPLGRYLGAVALGRFPRYALLAWLGVVVELPSWALPLVCILLLGAWFVSTRQRSAVRGSSSTDRQQRKEQENERSTCSSPHDNESHRGLGETTSAADGPRPARLGDP